MSRIFPASVECLYDMLSYIKEETKQAGFSPKLIEKIELAAEEAIINIIKYGYHNSKGQIEIAIQRIYSPLGGRTVKIELRDKGIPYNPLMSPPKVDVKAPLEQRTLGGYGIFFILKIMDEVDYRRENDLNILTLTKYL